MARIEQFILLVTKDPESVPGSGWVVSDNLAEFALRVDIEDGRQPSSLRFSPRNLHLSIDVSDNGLFPESTAVYRDLMRSEIYVAAQSYTYPRILFHGWPTEAEWVHDQGAFRTLEIYAEDALGHIAAFQSNLSSAPMGGSSSSWWTAHEWLRQAARTGVSNPDNVNKVRALSRGLDFASPSSYQGPRLQPVADYFERGSHLYPMVLQEIRHQTQGRIGIAHGWEARYPNPIASKNNVLQVWGNVSGTTVSPQDSPLPSFLGAEYLGSLVTAEQAFLNPTAPVGNANRELLFSEKIGDLDSRHKPEYAGYQWVISDEPSFEGAAEPEASAWPRPINDYQRGRISISNRGSPTGPDYFSEYQQPDESLLAVNEETLTSMGSPAYTYDWSNWIIYNDTQPRLHLPELRLPLHFTEPPSLVDAILASNLFTKVRVRIGGRSSQLLDRFFRVDGIRWEFQSFSRLDCGLTAWFNLIEVRQEAPEVLDFQFDPVVHRWDQSRLDDGNILV